MHTLAALLLKDWRALLNLRRVAREQSRFKMIFILAFALGIFAGLWGLFYAGFHALHTLGGIGVLIIRHLFALFYLGLGLMLVLSNVIAAHAALYRAADIPCLLPRPASHGAIVLHKLAATALFSSWAFFGVIIPFVSAFARHENLSPWFIGWTLLLSVPFVLLCAELGLLLTLLAARWIPRWRPAVWAGLLLAAAAAWAWIQFRPVWRLEPGGDILFLLEHLAPGLRLASYPLWPSWWTAEGILALARGQWLRGLMLGGVLLANVLAAGLLVAILGRACWYTGWLRKTSDTRPERRRSAAAMFPARALAWLPAGARGLVHKDLLAMARDPVQWTQGFLFFGLLALYFFNLRNLRYDLLEPAWLNLIAFLNLFSLAAIMCSFCSRFVFPQLSLEGQGFWILGLSPLAMGRVLKIKFALAAAAMLVLSLPLLAVSCAMLRTGPGVLLTGLLLAAAMSAALSGLATGLGAVFLNLRQPDPAVIVSGFGGTLNLALSLLYMLAAILPFGLLFHWRLTVAPGSLFPGWLLAAAWLALLTTAAVLLPLAVARRSLRAREF